MTDQPGPNFDKRLKAEVERFRPPTPLPQNARFSRRQPSYRPFGGIKLALATAGGLAVLTVVAASAATGTNPSSWPQRAVKTVESATHVSESSPQPSPMPQAQPQVPALGQPPKAAAPSPKSPEPSRGSRTEPKESPEPTGGSQKESPEPTGGSQQEPKQSPEPSPTPPHDNQPSLSPEPRSNPLSWSASHNENRRSDIGRTERYQ